MIWAGQVACMGEISNAYISGKKRNIEKEIPLGRTTCEIQEVGGLIERGCWWTDMITPLCVQFLAIKARNARNQRIGHTQKFWEVKCSLFYYGTWDFTSVMWWMQGRHAATTYIFYKNSKIIKKSGRKYHW